MTSPWALVVVLVLILLNRPIRMISMKVVFWLFGTSKKDQAAWVRREASQDRLMDALTGFWNRPTRRRVSAPVQRIGPRRADDEDQAA